MEEWLFASMDPSREHLIGGAISWHARLMVLSWGILLPLGVVIARYFKVLPGQNWPLELDNKFWWRSHLTLQISGGVIMTGGLLVVLVAEGGYADSWYHRAIGWTVIALAGLQFLSGWLRGTKGGPGDQASGASLAGDHYDMTVRRIVFEKIHKTVGYFLLLSSAAAIIAGLWIANAPNWMWLLLSTYWAGLITLSVVLQLAGRAVDTYQAIWGPDESHPGNRRR
ncbi:MAG: cytochrome b561 domain-containing protein [Stappiaceae bacterium]